MFIDFLISHSDTDTQGRDSRELADRRRVCRFKDATVSFIILC